jgi:hypothetical protein
MTLNMATAFMMTTTALTVLPTLTDARLVVGAHGAAVRDGRVFNGYL